MSSGYELDCGGSFGIFGMMWTQRLLKRFEKTLIASTVNGRVF
jgi:hypothetical protein